MDELDRGQTASADSLARQPRHPRIGAIGKGTLTEYETAIFWHIGKAIAKLGHTLVIVPAPGVATALRKGVEVEEGLLDILREGVVEQSDQTLLFPDPKLLLKLKTKYPDIETRDNVLIITEDQLDQFYGAIRTILEEKGITP